MDSGQSTQLRNFIIELPHKVPPSMAPVNSNLLRLPVELLQHISGYVSVEWLPVLRLSCKELSAASFDAFAEAYIHHLVCYFPDPGRLERIRSLLSLPQIAPKVQVLKLTAHFLERHTSCNIDIVAKKDEPHRKAQDAYGGELWGRHAQLYHAVEPDFSSLKDVLKLLAGSKCEVSLDLVEFSHLDFQYALYSRDLLDAMAGVANPVTALRVSDDSLYGLDSLYARNGALASAFKGLRQIQYHCPDSYSEEPEITTDLVCLLRIVSATEHLEHLSFNSPWTMLPEWLRFSRDMLLGNSLSYLQTLSLDSVRLESFEVLFRTLKRCSSTLSSIMLRNCEVDCASARVIQFLRVLQILREMPRLARLFVSGFELRGALTRGFIYVKNTEQPGGMRLFDVAAFGRQQTEMALDQALEWGQPPDKRLFVFN